VPKPEYRARRTTSFYLHSGYWL